MYGVFIKHTLIKTCCCLPLLLQLPCWVINFMHGVGPWRGFSERYDSNDHNKNPTCAAHMPH